MSALLNYSQAEMEMVGSAEKKERLLKTIKFLVGGDTVP